MGKMRTKKNKINFFKYMSIFLSIVSIIVLLLIYFINVLPLEYFIVLFALILLIDIIVIMLLLSKSKIKNVFGTILSLILIIIMIFGITYELNTIDFLKQFGFNSYKTEKYNVVVLKESEYTDIADINNFKIGHLNQDDYSGLKEGIKKIEAKITFQSVELEDITNLLNELIDKNVEAIILEDAQLEIIEEENYEEYEQLKIIYSVEVEIEIPKIGESVDVTKYPFNIFVSGIDTYGSVTKSSRSDVNILVSINPSTHKILLTNIPRDYYVLLPEFNAYDKLTHAGIYGIETSISAVEELLDTKINYYVKVNFTSLIDIVDALGGITINSKYDFVSKDGYHYTKGENYLNGKETLSFVRERKAFALGDRVRGENQEIVLEALINKAMSPKIIIQYNDLLNALSNKFVTNITNEEMTKFIKKQIEEVNSWDIESISLDGTDSYEYTYSYKSSKLYVMQSYKESVTNAKNQIANILQ